MKTKNEVKASKPVDGVAHRRPTDAPVRKHAHTHFFTDVDRACRKFLRERKLPMNGFEDYKLRYGR